MRPIQKFQLQPLSGREGQSTLVGEEGPTGPIVPGVRLEKQFECLGNYLLLTTNDVPFEEDLHLILLSPRLELLDELRLGAMYTPGMLRDVEVRSDDELEFSFFGKERWRLKVTPTPRLRILERRDPGVSVPAGRFTKRYLELMRIAEDSGGIELSQPAEEGTAPKE